MESPPTSDFRQYLVTIIVNLSTLNYETSDHRSWFTLNNEILLCLISVNLSTLNYGMLVGWPSPVQPQLANPNPAIGDIPFTDDMMAHANSMVYCGATLGSCFWGAVANRLGRKKTSVLIIVPYMISWSLLVFTNSRVCLSLARFVGGIGNAGAVINNPMYVAEISSQKLKDRLGPFLFLTACVGVLYCYVCGWLLPFHLFNKLNLLIATLSTLATCFLPESPVYYLRCNQYDKAKQSIAWLRYYRKDNEQHQQRMIADLNTLEASFLNQGSVTPWRDIVRISSTRNAVLVGIGLITAIQMTGIAVVLVNAVFIFTSIGSNTENAALLLPPHLSSIIVAVVQLLSGVGSVYLLSHFNRKPLLIVSYLCMGFAHIVLGSLYFLKFINFPYEAHASFIPLVCLSLFIIAYNIAAGPTSFLILSEIFPAETRNICMGIVMVYQHALMWAVVRSFPLMKATVGMFGSLWTYAIATIVSVVFISLFVPETRNKTFKEIVRRFNNSHKTQTFRVNDSFDKLQNLLTSNNLKTVQIVKTSK
uniref:Facilitated trehalose transporter Tret1 n=1 Tax=Cacopsylla melanoneura TaxID=428564 RepID=A0A8D9EI93_9HEMI